ncbi:LuxR C-terminal-related transcriptional regulator [Desulfosarcina ovata]|uniref:HTH luxR-type domain-containing protein n=2 Tax=Desulfosarcina ovata TaxID=83564 RepID=A0A5K8AE53_9BACT|nr:LuxR C-terminal-related transcriptional regulator [Desulfosarcina ovata]BBO83003.1 hypothetical protein DSCO28_35690 [Desulfosarcina ovata subsp. sediminis]BBO90230.1 hypothetical protein DSCOOX_34100 [Desulfosarcina ovata subsp. ovata]
MEENTLIPFDKEAHQKNNEPQLNAILEGNPIPTFVVNTAGRITHWNHACELLTNVLQAEIIGTDKHRVLFYNEYREVLADFIARGASEAELSIRHDGKYRRSALIQGGYEGEAFFPKIGDNGKWLFYTAAPVKDRYGKIVGAIETIQDTTRQKEMIRALEEHKNELNEKSNYLEKVNLALKAALDNREIEKRAVEVHLLANLKRLVFPYLDALGKCKVGMDARAYVNIINTNLSDIVSRISTTVISKYINFTPAEIRVADFIREGKNTKEIAELLGVSPSSVKWHRKNIRKKLELTNKALNLYTYLNSLGE